jgi:outer membrane protein TolC
MKKGFWLFLFCLPLGCGGSLRDIDRRVDVLMFSTSTKMGAVQPEVWVGSGEFTTASLTNEEPPTVNPPAELLGFVPAIRLDENEIAKSLDRAADDLASSGEVLSLEEVLVWASEHAKEMQFAQYDYLSSTLSLLSELHLWGSRFYNTISSTATADSSSGLYNTSLVVVNDFNVSHKLPSGGSVSAGALTTIARDIHTTTTGNSKSSSLELSLDIPLLRGAGTTAQESLIQSKRNLVYAARSYERFRRLFYREIVGDYLSLVVQKQSLENAQRGVDSLRQLAKRQAALYVSGRTRLYDSADAENQALASVARLSQSWERFRLALDRFKIRIGWPIENIIQVAPAPLGLVPPDVDTEVVVWEALQYRLDLQNEKDRVVDTQRGVENSLNDLLPDLNFTASGSLVSNDDQVLGFGMEEVDYAAGLSLSLPIDRDTERIRVRQQQIVLEKAKRKYRESRDNVIVSVRSSLRNIEVFQFTLDLQERNVKIAKLGLDSINADPDRVSVLDQTRAISDLQGAQDARDSAKKDLELSILGYLLQAGRLRVSENGTLLLPVYQQE